MTHQFSGEGYGNWVASAESIKKKWAACNAIVFDWDGVFNNGEKDNNGGSSYSEIDSMGTNMLRLSYWLSKQRLLPIAIISGEHNPLAAKLAKREHFNAVYAGIKNKAEALNHFCSIQNIAAEEVAFVFDDVLDFSMAELCALRFMVYDTCKVQTMAYAIRRYLVDYITRHQGGKGAVREVCELLIACADNDTQTFDTRKAYDEVYKEYLHQRSFIATQFFSFANDKIIDLP